MYIVSPCVASAHRNMLQRPTELRLPMHGTSSALSVASTGWAIKGAEACDLKGSNWKSTWWAVKQTEQNFPDHKQSDRMLRTTLITSEKDERNRMLQNWNHNKADCLYKQRCGVHTACITIKKLKPQNFHVASFFTLSWNAIPTCQQNCGRASPQLLLCLRISYTIQSLLKPYTLAAILLNYFYCSSAISTTPFTLAKQICNYAIG